MFSASSILRSRDQKCVIFSSIRLYYKIFVICLCKGNTNLYRMIRIPFVVSCLLVIAQYNFSKPSSPIHEIRQWERKHIKYSITAYINRATYVLWSTSKMEMTMSCTFNALGKIRKSTTPLPDFIECCPVRQRVSPRVIHLTSPHQRQQPHTIPSYCASFFPPPSIS
jgi:hypothetical protein